VNALIKRFLVLAMALPFGLLSMCSPVKTNDVEAQDTPTPVPRYTLSAEEWGAAIYNDALTALQQDLEPENFRICFRAEHCGESIFVIDGNVYQYYWEEYTLPGDDTKYEHQKHEYRSTTGVLVYDSGNSDDESTYVTKLRSLAECSEMYREIGEEFLSLMESEIPREFSHSGSLQMGRLAVHVSRAAFDREGLADMGYDSELPYLYVDDISEMIYRSNSEDMVNFPAKDSYAISYNDTDVSEWLEKLDFPQELIVWD